MNRLYNCIQWPGLYILLIVFAAGAVHAQSATPPQNGILRMKVTPAYATRLEQSTGGRRAVNVLSTGSAKLNAANARYRATSLKRVFPDAGKYEAKHRKHGLHLWYEVEIDSTAPLSQARAAYQDIPEIDIVETVHKKAIIDYDQKKSRVLSPTEVGPIKNSVAAPAGMNDPLLDRQWHYYNHGQTDGKIGADVDLLKAWSIEAGKKNVIVAIVDGGVEVTHPDLKDNVWTNTGEVPNNGIDDDRNGFVDDIHGYSFVDAQPVIKPHPHGTHVAGTVSAANNNGIGVSGVAGGTGNGDGVRLMSCAVFKFLTPEVEIAGGFENAYVYAADNGAVICQNSWGYNEFDAFDQVVLDAIDYFIAEAGQNENGIQSGPMKGGIVIFSAGNDGSNGRKYPAYYDHTLSVAALTHRDLKAYYSNYGDWVDIAAPGGEAGLNPEAEGILSTYLGGQYVYYAGTSMAAPHVSGTAALVVSHFGGANFTPDMLRQRIVSSADYVDNDNPDYAGMLGVGRVNAFHALQGENDLTGPAAITDLSVKSVDENALTLQWTAPADGGSHSVSYYEMRYATSPITPANFTEATYVSNQPRTGPAGTTETFTLPGLQRETNYYVALVAYDMFRNISLLSNVAQATTHLPEKGPAPIFKINPSPLDVQMLPTDSVVKAVYVKNTGDADLQYTIERNEGFSSLEEIYHILTFSKRSGTLAPGKTDTLLLTFEPFEMGIWIYEEFTITTNDPENSKVLWPIQLTFSETKGKPVFSTTQLDVGKTMVGTNTEKTINLNSKGSQQIKLLKYSIDNPDFSAYIGDFYVQGYYGPFYLGGYDSVPFKVFFRPSTTGKVTGVLTIKTDDPEYPILTLPLSGEGLPAPIASVNTDTLSASLKTNEAATRTIMLSNTGTSEMTFDMLDAGLEMEPTKVLVVCPDAAGVGIPALLSPFKEITVDVADLTKDLTLARLAPYDVVIVLNQAPWERGANIQPDQLGDLLADYVDAGGKVIVNQFAYYGFQEFDDQLALGGRFITGNYGPFTGDVTTYIPPQSLGEILIPNHPLIKGVNTLTYTGSLQRAKLSPGATGIAKWLSGEWVLAANANVIAMNFMPMGQRSSDQPVTGDVRQLYRNAIHWLAGSSNIAVEPTRGKIAPGESVELHVEINSNKLATGLYRSALGVTTNDPYHGQRIIPVGIQVEGPSFSLEPDAISLRATTDQQATQTATLRNEGTSTFPYAIRVQHIQSLSPVVPDSTSRQYFSTGFARYDMGRFTGRQDWLDSGKWYIDTVAAFSGKHHLRYTSNGIPNPVKLITPVIETGAGKSFCSAKIMIVGQGTSFALSPLALPSYFAVTTVTFADDGSTRVVSYNAQAESFDVQQISEPVPTGYFTLSIELDKATSIFNVYFDQKLVFTGTAPFGSINAMAFESDNRHAGQHLYIDNVVLRQDGMASIPDFLNVSPISGVLAPGEAATLTVKANAQGLQAGTYGANVVAMVSDGIGQHSIPVLFTVTGGASAMKVSHDAINATVDHNATEARFFEITNTGGEPFQFTVDVPEDVKSWLSVEPASGTIAPNSIAVIKVRYSSATLDPGAYSSTIAITSDAANLQSKVVTTSLEVREPARLFFGPPFIQIELIGGNVMDFPLSLTNGGVSVLRLQVEETGKEWLRVDTNTKYLQPAGGQLVMPIKLSAVDIAAGIYKDTLHIHTSDPENPSIEVPVQLTVIAPSALQISGDALSFTLAPGEQASKTLSIANTGTAELRYAISDKTIPDSTPDHGGPDTFGYTFIATGQPGGPAFVWNDISATGTSVTLGDYDSITVALPFAFPFYGEEQHEVKIVSDGFLAFNTVGLPTRTTDDRILFNASAPNNIIAGHWDDLDPRASGTIHYQKEADKFTVQYTHVAINSWGFPTEPMLQNTFQIVLYADGTIALHYLDIMNSAQQVVGIENADATDGLLIKNMWDYPFVDSATVIITPTLPWMTVTSPSNALQGGDQDQVDVQFDATDLQPGIYSAVLYITSDDQKHPVERLPVTMRVDRATGTEQVEEKEIVSLYPVPAKDVLNIRLAKKITQPFYLSIKNAQGQTVFEQETEPSHALEYAFDLHPLRLAPGIYFLQVLSPDGQVTTKPFVKQ